MNYVEIPIEKLPHRNVADILIITATSIETEKLHEKLDPIYEGDILKVSDGKNVYYLAKPIVR